MWPGFDSQARLRRGSLRFRFIAPGLLGIPPILARRGVAGVSGTNGSEDWSG